MALHKPKGYVRDPNCNGCGSGWNAKLVPDRIYGLDITEVCCIHDYMYEVGKTAAAKEQADRVFLINLLRVIEAKKAWWFPHFLARRRALKYYEAVKNFGDSAFWKGKEK